MAIVESSFILGQTPAAISELGRKQFDLSLSVFNPSRSYETNSNALKPIGMKVESENPFFLIPSIGYSSPVGNNSAVGVAMFAKGGGSVAYDNHATYGNFGRALNITDGNDQGVWTATELQQMGLAAAYSYKFNDQLSIGLGPVLGIQRFKAIGLGYFIPVSGSPANLTDKGWDSTLGLGAAIGVHSQLSSYVSLGVGYQSRVKMQRFKKYSGLFADEGEFDMAPELNVGFGFIITPHFRLALDYQRIYYSQIPALSNDHQRPLAVQLTATEMAKTVGVKGGAGFGWDDVEAFKVGIAYDFSAKSTVKAGYSYGNSPIGSEDVLFNILAPAVPKQHLAAGYSYKFREDYRLDLAYVRTLENQVSGVNENNMINKELVLEMDQHDFEIGLSILF